MISKSFTKLIIAQVIFSFCLINVNLAAPTSTSIQLNGRDTKVDDGLITRDVNEQKSFKDFAHKVEKAFGGIARDVNDDNGLVTRNAFKDFVHKIEGKVDAIKDLPSRVNE